MGSIQTPPEAGVWQHKYDAILDLQIIQIAANIIDQFDGDGYPTLIYFNPGLAAGLTPPTVAGVENLPYIIGERIIMRKIIAPTFSGSLTDPITNPGVGAAFIMPHLWNPHDQNGSLGEPRPTDYRIYAESNPPDSPTPTTPISCEAAALGIGSTGNTTLYSSPSSGTTLVASTSEISFKLPTAGLFREPSLVGLVDTSAGGLPLGTAFTTGPGHLIRSAKDSSNNLLPGAVNGCLKDYSITRNGAATGWVGFFEGTFPLAFYSAGNAVLGIPAGNYTTSGGQIVGCASATFRIDYLQHPSTSASPVWATYDTHYTPNLTGGQTFGFINISALNVFTDPRTARFSARGGISGWTPIGPASSGLTNPPIVYASPRDTTTCGMGFNLGQPGLMGAISPASKIGWFGGGWSGAIQFYVGLFSENDPNKKNGSTSLPQYYTDTDGVCRRAMGDYVLTTSGALPNDTIGLPMATASTFSADGVSTPTTQSQSRPFILNRPFRSVTELGYVFSDTPWKNLDFIFPESGDAPLLDVFCIREDTSPDALVAGKVNLNTHSKPVLKAVLTQAYKDELAFAAGTATFGGNTTLTSTEADNVAAKLLARTGSAPLCWKSELVGRYDPVAKTYDGFSADLASGNATTSVFTATDTNSPRIPRFRESTMRALVDVGTTRTWTLLIDLVAQTGRYPKSAAGLSDFMVEGEKRYWLHVSIDRMTGQVVDRQVELVNE